MGLGIEHRARTLAPYWAEHLQRTRSAQARWARCASGACLTVLGAGRLRDFNHTALLPRFAKFRMVDADKSCGAAWKRLPRPVEPVCLDITGCVDEWIRAIARVRKPWPGMLDAIRKFRAPAGAAYRPAGDDAILSLNILSQLQIVWQDGVEAVLQKRFGKRFVELHEDEWLDALRPAGQTLVEQHLAAMESAAPKRVLLITDLEYLEYRGIQFQQDRWAPPPVVWSEENGWSPEGEISCEVSPALEGVVLDEATYKKWLPSYRLSWQESWLWHIAPLGTEKLPHGKVHRVGAFALERTG